MRSINYGIYFLIVFLHTSTRVYTQENIRFHAYGHTPKTISDSLYFALKTAKNPSQQLELLTLIAQEHLSAGNADSAIYYVDNIRKYSNTNSYYSLRAKFVLGKAQTMQGLYDEALKTYIEGISLSSSGNTAKLLQEFKLGISDVYIAKNEFDKASPVLLEILDAKEESPTFCP